MLGISDCLLALRQHDSKVGRLSQSSGVVSQFGTQSVGFTVSEAANGTGTARQRWLYRYATGNTDISNSYRSL